MQRSGLETGTVLHTDGMTARVITNKSKSCNECGKAQAGICGKQGAGMVMEARNTLGAEKGDTVTLGLDRSTHIKAYLAAFILPVVALFFFSFMGIMTGIPGLDAILGISALVLSLAASLVAIRKIERSSKMQITGIITGVPAYAAMSPEELDYLRAFGGR